MGLLDVSLSLPSILLLLAYVAEGIGLLGIKNLQW